LIAAACLASAAAGVAVAAASWLARQSLLATSPEAAGGDDGAPLLGMWMFLIAAALGLALGAAALVRLRAGAPGRRGRLPRSAPPASGGRPRWAPAPRLGDRPAGGVNPRRAAGAAPRC
ncbi:MAG: hypothetical protein LBQ06_08040, partial [Frankiaceae bacterium]|nr:hypothetical protein [Frankiaceae bacterium]